MKQQELKEEEKIPKNWLNLNYYLEWMDFIYYLSSEFAFSSLRDFFGEREGGHRVRPKQDISEWAEGKLRAKRVI